MNVRTSTAEHHLRDAVSHAANGRARYPLLERVRHWYGRIRIPLFLAFGGGVLGIFLIFTAVFGLNRSETSLIRHFPSAFFLSYVIAVLLLGKWSRRSFEKRLTCSEVALAYCGTPMTDAEIFSREWRTHRGQIRAFLFGRFCFRRWSGT